MTREEQVFLSLLRASLHGDVCDLAEYGSLSTESWEAVYKLSAAQGLQGVVFSAIEKLPEAQIPPVRMRLYWYGKVAKIVAYNEQYRAATKELVDILRQGGVEVAILKGLECAKYYPQPDRRYLGDLDVFATVGSYEDVNEICQKAGLKVENHDYKHSKINYKGISVENHQFCTEIRGEKVRKEFERRLQGLLKGGVMGADGLRCLKGDEGSDCLKSLNGLRCLKGDEGSDCLKSLNGLSGLKEFNFVQFNALFLMAHAFGHFLDEGISLRQICDWAMFLKGVEGGCDGLKGSKGCDGLKGLKGSDGLKGSKGCDGLKGLKGLRGVVDWKDFYYWMDRMHMRRFADAMNAIAVEELGITIHCTEVATTSPYKEKILLDALHGQHHLHSSGLKGWAYRWAQLKNTFGDSWKYRDICQQHVLVEYLKGVWYYLTEKEPTL